MYYIINDEVSKIKSFISDNNVDQVSLDYKDTVMFQFSDEQDQHCYLQLKEIDITVKVPSINKWRLLGIATDYYVGQSNVGMPGITYYPGGEKIIAKYVENVYVTVMTLLQTPKTTVYILYNESTNKINYTIDLKTFLNCDVDEFLRINNNINYIADRVIKTVDIIELTHFDKFLLFDFKDVLFTALNLVKQDINCAMIPMIRKLNEQLRSTLDDFPDQDIFEECYNKIKTSNAREYKDIRQIYIKNIIGEKYFEHVITFCKQYLSTLNFTSFFGKINHEYVLEVYPYFTTSYLQKSEIKYVTKFYRNTAQFVCFTDNPLFDATEIELLKNTFVKIRATVSQHKHYCAGVETILTNVKLLG